MTPFRTVALALAFLVSPAFAALTPKQKADNLASFEVVWSTVRDRHPDPTFNGLQWKSVHDETLPTVERAKSMDDFRQIVTGMLDRLGTSHYGIVPNDVYKNIGASSDDDPIAKDRGNPGVTTLVIDGKAVVSSVAPGSPAQRAGIKAGMVLDDVNGASIGAMLKSIGSLKEGESELIMQRSVARKLAGPVDQPVTLRLIDENGHPFEAKLEREPPKGDMVTFANLPPVRLAFDSKRLPSGAGYITFNYFLNPVTLMPQFESAVESFAQSPGIILDLRGNPGGIGFMATGIAGFFLETPGLNLGEMKTHELSLKFVVFPRAKPYTGPLAILVDGGSASTSEIFAGGLQDLKRARIFGTKTAGAALPSDFMRLPNGDGFQFAMATYKSESGKVLEGNGVTPDVEVAPTQTALAAGDDLVLEAADAWIKAQARKL